jgi:hypothetical protein
VVVNPTVGLIVRCEKPRHPLGYARHRGAGIARAAESSRADGSAQPPRQRSRRTRYPSLSQHFTRGAWRGSGPDEKPCDSRALRSVQGLKRPVPVLTGKTPRFRTKHLPARRFQCRVAVLSTRSTSSTRRARSHGNDRGSARSTSNTTRDTSSRRATRVHRGARAFNLGHFERVTATPNVWP